MKQWTLFLSLIFVFLLSSCGGDEVLNNFESRRDGTLFTTDGRVLVEYTTDKDGKLISLNIDRILTLEEMFILSPVIDYELELDDFDGDIFMLANNQCTSIRNNLLVPINIEIGNTRYKFDNTECKYKTVDSNNNFRAGFADEYFLTQRIQEDRRTTISIIVYQPEELVKFIELYQIPHTYELMGVYHLLPDITRQDLAVELVNYYNDTGIYEQLYLKHQENEATINEINGMSEELNLMDLSSLTEMIPLIEDFEELYALEIDAIEQLQEEIGINFTADEEEEDPDQEETE